jgi:hypothetical protein
MFEEQARVAQITKLKIYAGPNVRTPRRRRNR